MSHAENTTYKTNILLNINVRKRNSKCKSISKDKETHGHNKQIIGGGWKYRLGTVSDKCHWEFKPVWGRPTSHLFHHRPKRQTV